MKCDIKYKRVLIPPGILCLCLPFFVDEVQAVLWIALLYFVGSFMLLINFPYFSVMLHSKPIYYEDLSIIKTSTHHIDTRFKTSYKLLMIFCMSVMMGALADYMYISVGERPAIECLGIIGGNMAIYLRIQNMTGKVLLKICYYCKTRELKNESIVDDKSEEVEKSEEVVLS
jgi:hypothetical protein